MGDDTFQYSVDEYRIEELESMLGLARPYTSVEVQKKTENLFLLISDMNHPELKKRSQFLYETRKKLNANLLAKQNRDLALGGRRRLPASPVVPALGSSSSQPFNSGTIPIFNSNNNNRNHIFDRQERAAPRQEDIIEGSVSETTSFFPNSDTSNKSGLMNVGGGAYPKGELKKTSILVDTRFRDNLISTNSNSFQVTLSSKVKNVVAMQMSSYEFPLTFYSVSQSYGNNTFKVSLTYTQTGSGGSTQQLTEEKVIVVDDGNYIASDLVDEINAIFSVTYSGTAFEYVVLSVDVNAYGSGTGKITFSADASDSTDKTINSMSLRFDCDEDGYVTKEPITSRFGYTLGFLQPSYVTAATTSYTGDGVADTSGLRYFYISVEDFNRSTNSSFVSGMQSMSLIDKKNVIARLQVKGTFFDMMMENDQSTISIRRKYRGPVEISKLHVEILDDHARLLNLNNGNYSFCLDLFYYDEIAEF
jgi:hypothetical protein